MGFKEFKRGLAIVLAAAMVVSSDSFLSYAAETGNGQEALNEALAFAGQNATPVDATDSDEKIKSDENETSEESKEVEVEADEIQAINGSSEESDNEADEDELLSDEEMEELCGYRELEDQEEFPAVEESAGEFEINGSIIPSQYNATSDHEISITSAMPKLRSQYNGTCWAHTSMALAELSMLNQGYFTDASTTNLCELQLAYFSYHTVVDPLGGIDGDSNTSLSSDVISDTGGNLILSENVLANWIGAGDESLANEYDSTVQAQVDGDGLDETIAYNDSAILTGYRNVNLSEDPEAVKKLIIENGGVGTSFYAAPSTSSSYYNSTNNCYYCPDKCKTNHAVTIVGWDDTYPKENFITAPSTDGAWLIRNSWLNEESGNYSNLNRYYGYFWLSYCDASISSNAFSFIFSAASDYDHNYQYDGAMDSSSFSCGTETKGANVYTVKGNDGGKETLKAVSFATNGTNESYIIKIYKFASDDETYKTNPEGGDLEAEISGTTSYAGLYTAKLDETVVFDQGDIFSVVVDLTSDTGSALLNSESSGSTANFYQSTASAKEYQSFYYSGSSWVDFGKAYSKNLRIKAYTCNGANGSDDVTITAFQLSSDDENGDYITCGSTKQLKVTTTPSNKSSKLTYSSSDDSIVSISKYGYMTANAVGKAVITASATIGGETVSKSINVYVGKITISGDSQGTTGKTGTYTYTFEKPDELADETCTFSSDDASIIKITSDGKASYLKNGTALIRIASTHYSAALSVTVAPGEFCPSRSFDADGVITFSWNEIEGVDSYTIKDSAGNQICKFDSGEASYSYDWEGFKGENITTTSLNYIKTYIAGNVIHNSGVTYINVYVGKPNRIIYVLNGGTNASANKEYVNPGSRICISDPSRTGYSFGGWYEDAEYTTSANRNHYGNKTEDDYTVYAKWTPIYYLIRYNANNGTSSTFSKYQTYDTAGTIAANTFSKTGYTFKEWNTAADGSGTSYAPGDSALNLSSTQGESVDVYAIWEGAPITVSFDAGDGVTNPDSITATYGKTYGTLPTVSKAGYQFAGWYTSAGSQVTSTTTVTSTTDLTLTAKYTPNTYTVSYQANYTGATVSTDSATETVGVSFTVGTDKFTRTGYDLTSWNTSSDGTKTTYNDGATVSNLTLEKDATVKLYAVWTPKNITVSFDAGSGATNPDSITVDYNGAYGTLPTPSRAGYQFVGWYTEADTLVTSSTVMTSTEAVTLTAKYTPNTYTVKYHLNYENAEDPYATETWTYGTGSEFKTCGVTNGTKKFAHWNTKTDNSGASFNAGETGINLTTEADGTVDLYAIWSEGEIYVTFEEYFSDTDTTKKTIKTYKKGDAYGTLPTATTRTGYTFDGWYLENGTTKLSATDTITSEVDYTVYARWSPIIYSINYYPNYILNVGDTASVVYTTAKYDEDYVIQNCTFKRTGYSFKNWNTKADGSGTAYSNGTKVKNLSDSADGTINLYAIWEPLTINVQFNGGDGTSSETYRNYKYGDTYGELPTASLDGYTFLGWYTEADGGTIVSATDTITSTENYTLYAHYHKITEQTQKCATPVISVVSKDTDSSIKYFEITDDNAAASIYYTTDGTTPSSSSTLYTDKIEITKTTTIKAIAICTGYEDSEIATATYTVEDDGDGDEDDEEDDEDDEEDKIVDKGDITDEDFAALAEAGATDEERLANVPTGIWVGQATNTMTYTGKVLTPNIRVYYGNKRLTVNTDYTITNTNKKQKIQNVGSYTLKVTGKGNYSSEISGISFTIEACDITASLDAVSNLNIGYSPAKNKKGITPSFVVTYNGKKLKAGTDYKIMFTEDESETNLACALDASENAATYEFKLKGINNYTGETTDSKTMTLVRTSVASNLAKAAISFTDADMTKNTITYRDEFETEGATPEFTVKIGKTEVSSDNYDVTYSNNKAIGTATVTITAKGESYYGTKSATFKIVGTALSTYRLELYEESDTDPTDLTSSKGVTKVTYSGEAPIVVDETTLEQTGSLRLRLVNKKNKDDVIIVSDDTDLIPWAQTTYNKGKFKVTVTGKNKYTGKLTATLIIDAYNMSTKITDGADYRAIMGIDEDSIVNGPLTITYANNTKYSKGGAKPSYIKVTYNEITLTEGKDYKVAYSKNKAINLDKTIPYFVITGCGNFKNKIVFNSPYGKSMGKYISEFNFAITQQSITADCITATSADKVVSAKAGSANYSAPVVTDTASNTKLKAGIDYKVAYFYAADTTVKNSKTKLSETKAAGTEIAATDILPQDQMTKIKVVIAGINNYGYDTTPNSTTYRLYPKTNNLANAVVTVNTKTYTGKEIKINKSDITKIQIKVGRTYVDVPADSYEIVKDSYKNNVKKGTASVQIKGLNQYGGTKTIKFKIVQKALNNSN